MAEPEEVPAWDVIQRIPETFAYVLRDPELRARALGGMWASVYGGAGGFRFLQWLRTADRVTPDFSSGITRLYRAVSETEYQQLMRTSQFEAGPNSLGGKFFAENPADAARWGDVLEGAGKYRVVEVEVPSSAADSFMRWERLDNIGPARYGELEDLTNVVVREVEVS